MDYEFDLAGGTSEFYIDADYYDHEFKSRTADVQWYTQHYLETEGPALELAVGTGRVALRAVRKGAEIYGIDLSPTMLARARTRRDALPKSKRSKLHLIEGDMRTFSLDRKFELITCPFNAFQHLYTREDIEACLRCVREHLAPGGLFLFDVLLPDVEYLSRSPYKRFPGVEFRHPTHGTTYAYSEQTAYNPVTQVNQMWLHYDRVGPGAGPETFCIQLSHRCFFPQELQALLAYKGFEVLALQGDFEDGRLRPDSESMVVMATHGD